MRGYEGKMRWLVLALAFSAALSVRCGKPGPISGSGRVITESRPVSDFHEVFLFVAGEARSKGHLDSILETVFVWPCELIITQGDREALAVEAEDNIMPRITHSGGKREAGDKV